MQRSRRTAGTLAALGVLAAAGADPGAAAGPAPAEGGRTLAEWYALGGWIMHLVAACSVLTGAVLLERLFALRRGAVVPRRLTAGLAQVWDPRRPEAALRLCDASPSSLARLVRTGIGAARRGAEHPLEHVSMAGEAEALKLRRHLPLLAALANVATMIGLLGTVLGMIGAFDQIARVGTGDARVVASGIFQALITTAAGLSVGIGALAAHAFLRRRVDAYLLALEETVTRLFEDGPVPEERDAPEPARDLAPATR